MFKNEFFDCEKKGFASFFLILQRRADPKEQIITLDRDFLTNTVQVKLYFYRI